MKWDWASAARRVGVALRPARRWWQLPLGILIGLLAYWAFRPAGAPHAPPPQQPAEHAEHAARDEPDTVWTCSMHPEVRLPKPGLCPKCRMRLIPLRARPAEQAEEHPRRLAVSEHAQSLMDIETAAVERAFPTAEVRMVGKVEYDETRLAHITAWVPGRLDRLFVDYTGVPVSKGDHMVALYSPELISAQQELLAAARAARELRDTTLQLVRESTQATVEAAREKLRLWGLAADQIAEIEKRDKPEERVTINAPIGGIVISKDAQQGMYVQTGTRIYAIADLSRVWVMLDAYESDLGWLRYGQKAQFATVAYPGRTYTGTISFIDPILDPMTRTVKVRLNVPNEDGSLKPGMFVKAVVRSRVAAGGRVMDPALAGKWISPMHPEIVKDAPGTCDVCGMPLVKAETLGYVAAEPTEQDRPLVIPVSAALVTGKRAVVYVKVPGTDRPTFEGREIVLGPRAGDHYLVESGLREGELVVTRGQFKIDSELQIEARPSMMSPEGGRPMTGHQHGAHAPAAPPSSAAPARPEAEGHVHD